MNDNGKKPPMQRPNSSRPATKNAPPRPSSRPTAARPATSAQRPAAQRPTANAQKPVTQKPAATQKSSAKPAVTANAQKPVTQKPASTARQSTGGAAARAKKPDGRKRNIIIAAAIITALVVAFIVGGIIIARSGGKGKAHLETLNVIDNPDQGFYRPSFVALSADGAKASKPIYDDFTLYHLRVDISAFSAAAGGSDGPITQAALDGLEDVIEFYEERGRSVILRLAYDKNYGGKKDQEPSVELMTEHISAVSAVLNRHTDALTAVEVGMVGPWGEMHSSKLATPEVITALADAYLTALDERPVLVRTPKMIYDYLGITVNDLDGYVEPDGRSKRLGLFNDGYLGSANDLGTYTDRAKETEFLAKRGGLPYGGEVVVPGSEFHDIDKCTPEMFLMGLSYLNYEWNNDVVQKKWKNSKYTKKCGGDSLYYGQSAFTYIRNRLGYRFVLEGAELEEKDGGLNVSAKIKNVGFGELTRVKTADLLLVGADSGVAASLSLGEWTGGDIDKELDASGLASGEYKAYIKVHSGGKYPIRFANEDIYDETLAANLIGTVEI